MTTFQPWLNKKLPEAVQAERNSADQRLPKKVNVLVGEGESSDILAFLVLDRDQDASDNPIYIAHVPRHLPSYVAASAIFRLLCGIFISSTVRPGSCILKTPNGEDSEDLFEHCSWLNILPDYKSSNGRNTRSILFEHFLQLWAFASEIIPLQPLPYLPTSSTLRDGRLVQHPVRPVNPDMGKRIYSRYIPSLKAHSDITVCDQSVFSTKASTSHACNGVEGLSQTQLDKVSIRDEEIASTFNVAVCILAEKQAVVAVGSIRWSREDGHEKADQYDRTIKLVAADIESLSIWLPSICHYLFTVEVRTQTIHLEGGISPEQLAGIGFSTHDGASVVSRSEFFRQCPV